MTLEGPPRRVSRACRPIGRGRSIGRSYRRLMLAPILLVLVIAAGCGPAQEDGVSTGTGGSSGGEQVRLVYQDWRTEWFPPMAQRMIGSFNASHPNISVFYTPDPEDFEAQMLADMQAGTAPDVFQGCCYHFPVWAQEGYTLDLRPFVSAYLDEETIADWDPAQYRALAAEDGRQFGLPKYRGALAVYCNLDMFEEAGVAYPSRGWNYDDYLTAMKQLTRDTDGDGAVDVWGGMLDVSWDRLQVHANAWGGHFVDPEDFTKCAMAEPESLAALEWIRARMWDDRVMATPADVENLSTRDAFVDGRVAMIEDGSWSLKDILEKADFRVGVLPMPAGPAGRVTLATTDGFGIYAGTRYPEESWELLSFLISREYGRAMAEANLLQPARLSLFDEWVAFVKEQFPQKAADLNLDVFAEGQREGYSVTAEVFPVNMGEAARIANEAWARIFVVGDAPVDILVEASVAIERAQSVEE